MSTDYSKSDALWHLADALSEDILNTPAEDLLAEVAADHGNRRALATEFDRIFRRASRRARQQWYIEQLKPVINFLEPTPSLAIASIGALAVIIAASALSDGPFGSADRQPTNLARLAAGATESIVVAAAKQLFPNDRVDVVLIRPTPNSSGSRQSELLLQDIKVTAIDQIASPRAVTLDVTRDQAQEILLASNVGSLIVRKAGDGSVAANGQAAPVPSDTTTTIIRNLKSTD
jgi:hypothetical protein